jgi:hypothetical protein
VGSADLVQATFVRIKDAFRAHDSAAVMREEQHLLDAVARVRARNDEAEARIALDTLDNALLFVAHEWDYADSAGHGENLANAIALYEAWLRVFPDAEEAEETRVFVADARARALTRP